MINIEPTHTTVTIYESAMLTENYIERRVSRLGECEVCGSSEAKYTCPKCEVKTCCVACVKIHKKELECDGIRDRTLFIRMKNFTDKDLLSDYRMLEECSRFVYAVKRDTKKRFTRIDKDLPHHLYKLKQAALERGTVIQFLAQNFSRNISNTTRYHYRTNIIYWRVEWIFPNVDEGPRKFVDKTCQENFKLSTLLDKYLNPNAEPFEGSKSLAFYKAAGFSGVKVLLKAEKVVSSAKKFFELDLTESLADNLAGKCIVEFPIIFVVLKDHAYNFEIITQDEEFDKKDENYSKEENQSPTTNSGPPSSNIHQHKNRYKLLVTQKIALQKKIEIEKELKAERKRQPKNLLFVTGYSSEESASGCDSDKDAG